MFSIFEKYPNVVTELSKKSDGSMKLIGNAIPDTGNLLNRERFFSSIQIYSSRVVGVRPVHGNRVQIVTEKDAGIIIQSVDGLITSEKNLFLTLTVADCLPIFIYDPSQGVIGLLHAGWRGLAQNIIKSGINQFSELYNSNVNDLVIGVGPGIGACHFEVQDDVIDKFQAFLKMALVRRDSKKFLDLKKIASQQLTDAGISSSNVEISPICTYCSPYYFSFRRDKPKTVETMIAVIGLR